MGADLILTWAAVVSGCLISAALGFFLDFSSTEPES
jgi:hypothetical protein